MFGDSSLDLASRAPCQKGFNGFQDSIVKIPGASLESRSQRLAQRKHFKLGCMFERWMQVSKVES